jgi:hypothetical protein
MVLESFMMMQNVRSGHIYSDVMKQHMSYTLKCLLFEEIAKTCFSTRKSGFSQFSREKLKYLEN